MRDIKPGHGDWHGQLISILHPAYTLRRDRNMQSNAALAAQREVMRARLACATWQRQGRSPGAWGKASELRLCAGPEADSWTRICLQTFNIRGAPYGLVAVERFSVLIKGVRVFT
jgi:hypothetical protein